jgi:hypothetical protein
MQVHENVETTDQIAGKKIMKEFFSRAPILLAVLLLAFNVFAQDDKPTDAEGCKDSPLISRTATPTT